MKPFLAFLTLVLLMLAGCSHQVSSEREASASLPPLTDPATNERVPGKFVWVDLFTSDVEGVQRFYGELFGWEWRWVSKRRGHRYGMFYDDGIAMAGVAETEKQDDGKPYARWVYYISVEDVAAAVTRVEAAGGKTLLPQRNVPERGELAVLADREEAPFGVLRSSSGDPGDYRAEIGQWLWVGLSARDARAAADFYASVFGYEVYERSEVLDFVLASDGYSRAGIGELSSDAETDPTWLGFIRVDDLAAISEKAKTLGGEVLYVTEGESEEPPLGILTDPFGAPIGVMPWSFEDADEMDEVAGQ
jgi:predicted enzyme related to lactoylglutathione lyase